MQIFIEVQGQQTGPFSVTEIQQGLQSGRYQNTNLVWYQGASGWMPLSSLMEKLADPNFQSFQGVPANSGLALASMICGISAFLTLISSIPAIILGHMARRQIKKSNGRLSGDGMAITGLITGYIGLAFMLIVLAAALSAPVIMRQSKKAHQAQSLMNAKTMFSDLMAFQVEYGKFPNADTAKQVATDTGTPEITGESANARLRQLFQAGISSDETIFYVKTLGTRIPDNNVSGNDALAPGECGFAYIDNTPISVGSPRPLAIAPFLPGTPDFDPYSLDNHAIVLWTDGSATKLPIDPVSGKAMYHGQDILDPSHPVWGGTPPKLLLPE